MKTNRFAAALAFALAMLWFAPASAQSTSPVILPNGCGTANFYANTGYLTMDPSGKLCVNATVSASVSGFHVVSALTPITATTGGASSTSFTAGLGVLVSNTGTTNTAYCAPGPSASTSSAPVLPGQTVQLQTTTETQITCATSSSTTTVNLQTGNGLAAGWGGSGSGGSGSNASVGATGATVPLSATYMGVISGGNLVGWDKSVTVASGAVASGAYAAGSLAAGACVDGCDLTQGATTDAAATAGGTGSVSAKLRLTTTQLGTLATNQTNGTQKAQQVDGSGNVQPAGDVAARALFESPTNSGDIIITPSSNFTRPANTTAYAAGQTVANSVTAGSVTPLSWTAARVSAGNFYVRRVRMTLSSKSVTNASFILHLYSASPTVAAGDGATWSTTVAALVCDVPITITDVGSDVSIGYGVPAIGSECNVALASGQSMFGILAAAAAYTPASGETITVIPEIHQN